MKKRRRPYRVSTEKMRRLERDFRADLRWLKEQGHVLDQTKPAWYDEDIQEWSTHPWTSCGTCIVGAHLMRAQPARGPGADDLETAAALLRVDHGWLRSLYTTDVENDEPAVYPQARRLGRRLVDYAEKLDILSSRRRGAECD